MTRIPQALNAFPPQTTNPVISNLFKQTAVNSEVTKGSLITFNYLNWIHDPYPLLIVTDIVPGTRLRGVNLHYLTFNYIKGLLRNSCENRGFSYSNIRNDKYIVDAFRSYKWQGVRTVKKLDCNFLLTVMATVRSFDPSQVKQIRENIQQQLNRQVTPKAGPEIQPEVQ